MSQKHHKKQVDRARAQRRASAAEAKQRRVRVIAIVLVAALALSLFAAAIFAGGDDPSPEVASTPEGDDQAIATDDPTATEPGTDEATDPEATATDEADDAATGDASYANPQGSEAEPCPTDAAVPEPAATPYDSAPEMTIDPSATYVATIETTCGTIVVELAADETPVTVNNFVFLAEDGYYQGVPFHRVINGFMIQGGDPTGTGHGNGGEFPGYTFEDELEYAERIVGAEGGYPRGSLAMANAGPDTNGSQFFIVQAQPGYPLPPDYTLFGTVTEGMDVVDRIAQGPVEGDQAIDPVRILDVTIEPSGGESAG